LSTGKCRREAIKHAPREERSDVSGESHRSNQCALVKKNWGGGRDRYAVSRESRT